MKANARTALINLVGALAMPAVIVLTIVNGVDGLLDVVLIALAAIAASGFGYNFVRNVRSM